MGNDIALIERQRQRESRQTDHERETDRQLENKKEKIRDKY